MLGRKITQHARYYNAIKLSKSAAHPAQLPAHPAQLPAMTATPDCVLCGSACKIDPSVDRQMVQFLTAGAEGKGLVQSMAMVLKLVENKLGGYAMELNPDQLGVSPDNRDGYGLNFADVHDLLSDIFEVGTDERETRALCSEIPAKEFQAFMDFQHKLVKASAGRLVPPHETMLKFQCHWGTHTNQGWRLVRHSFPHHNPDMCVEGKLSVQKVGDRDKLMAHFCTSGMKWFVIPAYVMEHYARYDIGKLLPFGYIGVFFIASASPQPPWGSPWEGKV